MKTPQIKKETNLLPEVAENGTMPLEMGSATQDFPSQQATQVGFAIFFHCFCSKAEEW